MDVEITLKEQEVAKVQPGQEVALKARSLPFETFPARVERLAPAASPGGVQGSVSIYCRLEDAPADLPPGLTGHARVFTGRRSLAVIGLDRLLRYLRTEFWW